MALKNWLRDRGIGAGSEGGEPRSIDDLILDGRFEEAEALVNQGLRAAPTDPRLYRQRAEILMQTGRKGEAVEVYKELAGILARDGFYDKAHALLAKVARMVPRDEEVKARLYRLDLAKRLNRRRDEIVEGLREASVGVDSAHRVTPVELQRLWENLLECSLLEQLDGDQLKRLFSVFEARRCEVDEVVVEVGARSEELYLVAQGSVEARVDLAGGKTTALREFTAGQIVGEGALLEHRPWPATYVMAKAGLLLTLRQAGLEKAFQGNPDPRRLLEALRQQGNDRQILGAVGKLGSVG